ncbi:MAG TPA: alginate export family protein [Arenimonas sp.]|nr:alginate export family protein [Arenimonas sp.]
MKSPLALALLLALPALAQAQTAPAAPAHGFTVDLRLRHEAVDDDAFARDADATTLRARLGWRSPVRSGWSVFAEIEGTGSLGDSFNSTRNGHTSYPVIADPDNVELNQLYVNYQPDANTRATFGRQRLNVDNQRFFGAVGWRQNEQTFDAIDAQRVFGNGLTLRYSYLDRVQRIFGNDHPNRNLARWDLDTHLLSASIKAGPGTLTGYAHFIDNQTLPLSSHRNLGLRYAAKGSVSDALGWLGTLEFAQQDDYADGAGNIDAEYLLAEGGLVWKGYTGKLGFERLGGDGSYGFQTPFATGHAFNGWADKFLSTPVNGLDDVYVSVGGPLAKSGWAAKANWLLAFHDYSADHGSADYGQEWNAQLAFPITKGLTGVIKLADYQSRGFARDTQKLWLQLEWKR